MTSVRKTYDRLAHTYEHDIDNDSPYNAYYERPAMLKALPEKLEGKNILDAGCSAGWYAQYFASRGANVTAVDISPEMIEAAKRRAVTNVTYMCHDLETPLPFKDNSFDIICSSLTLHYIKEWSSPFQELARVLKPGGQFLFSVHHPFMDYHQFSCDDYFETTRLTDVWEKPSITIEVSFFRRSMQDIVNYTTSFFTLDTLIEPKPVDKMKEVKREAYEKLIRRPNFLLVKATSRK
ncbi:methyltransferase domain-containing protein [Pontibacillus salicampi]|uniref:Methyltransferase domain-containing protein n=1 Tax=Pontibacillus salicampi TaxID=1449801 RepID=A0ABV6LID1_9BACI